MRLIGAQTRTPRIGLRDRLVDAFIESYVEWREGCDDLRSAYQRWAGSAPVDRDLAFVAYRAALDREEKAALVHELRADQLARQAPHGAAPPS
jgi:hypothetical protein